MITLPKIKINNNDFYVFNTDVIKQLNEELKINSVLLNKLNKKEYKKVCGSFIKEFIKWNFEKYYVIENEKIKIALLYIGCKTDLENKLNIQICDGNYLNNLQDVSYKKDVKNELLQRFLVLHEQYEGYQYNYSQVNNKFHEVKINDLELTGLKNIYFYYTSHMGGLDCVSIEDINTFEYYIETDDLELKYNIVKYKIESPIEQMLYNKLFYIKGFVISPQKKIDYYQVDFLIRDTRNFMELIVECNGYEYHSSKEDMEHDYKRERFLQLKGYTVMKFLGTEIYNYPDKCVKEIQNYFDNIVERENKSKKVWWIKDDERISDGLQ